MSFHNQARPHFHQRDWGHKQGPVPLGVTPSSAPPQGLRARRSSDSHQGGGLLPQEAELIRNIQELLKRTIKQAVSQIRWVWVASRAALGATLSPYPSGHCRQEVG